jgi:hypothetical protein
VRPGNGAHAVGRRLIVEQDAAATVHLQVYEAGRHENARGNARLCPPGWNLVRRREAGDAAALDHHGSTAMPAAAVKNTVRNDGPPFGVWLVLAHICPR